MIAVNVQSLAEAASIAAVLLTAIGMFSLQVKGLRTELKAEIRQGRVELGELRTELRGTIASLEARTEAGFARVDARLTALDQRTFELSARLPPLPTAAT